MADKKQPVLSIENLTMDFELGKTCHAVRDTSVRIKPGEMVALVGESGCGKTMTALAAIGLQPRNAKIPQGKILFDGSELRGLTEDQWNQYRGRNIAMIFQEPMTALNPLMKVGRQIAENARIHGASKEEAKRRALEVMRQVGLPDVERLYNEYPHRLSGGMRQRVMIAMALVNQPELLIADEPTTALDVTIQAQIMELIRQMNREMGTAVLLISHDLGVIRQMCTRVYIMYAGRVVESGETKEVLAHPLHPYTKGLIASIPSLEKRGQRLSSIPGTVPALEDRSEHGCPFYNRCSKRREICEKETPPMVVHKGHMALCVDAKEELGTVSATEKKAPLLEIRGLTKEFRQGKDRVMAVHKIDLDIQRERSLAWWGNPAAASPPLGRCWSTCWTPPPAPSGWKGRTSPARPAGSGRTCASGCRLSSRTPTPPSTPTRPSAGSLKSLWRSTALERPSRSGPRRSARC